MIVGHIDLKLLNIIVSISSCQSISKLRIARILSLILFRFQNRPTIVLTLFLLHNLSKFLLNLHILLHLLNSSKLFEPFNITRHKPIHQPRNQLLLFLDMSFHPIFQPFPLLSIIISTFLIFLFIPFQPLLLFLR